MKNTKIFILSFTAIIVIAAGSAFGAYSGGSGTTGDPYKIATKADLLALADNTGDYGKCFMLTANIDMDGQVFTTAIIAADTDSNSTFHGTAFTGTFDGNGNKITHLSMNGGSNYYLGFFGDVSPSGSVKNLDIVNYSVSGYCVVGGLVGSNYGSITNCYSTGSVSGSYASVGGLVGVNHGSISNSYSAGQISGSSSSQNVGGLVGYNYGSLSNCYSTGSVNGYKYVGGLVGMNLSSISNCYSMGSVSGSGNVGGLVGYNNGYYGGSITSCYSTSSVSGSNGIGGLAGYNWVGNISNCYSTGFVGGSKYVGGLVGFSEGYNGDSSIIDKCYSTGQVAGSSYVGGLVGINGYDYDYGSIISNCYSTSAVSGTSVTGQYNVIGGLVGYNDDGGSISNCYSTGAVTGDSNFSWVGGLVGENCACISNSYSTGAVSGYYAGGLVGVDIYGSVGGSFWDMQTSGQTTSEGGTGKTTAEMKMLSTFTSSGWDFLNVWGINSGHTYPYLLSLNRSVPVVSNVSVAQRTDSSGIVDVYYTLSDADNDKCIISIVVSNDGGSTWTITPSSSAISGDVANVSPGNRHISWNSKLDLPGAYGSSYKIKVTANESPQ